MKKVLIIIGIIIAALLVVIIGALIAIKVNNALMTPPNETEMIRMQFQQDSIKEAVKMQYKADSIKMVDSLNNGVR